MPTIRITVDGKPAITVAQAAERRGVAASSIRAAISRLQLAAAAELDGRTPLYLVKTLNAVLDSRPGRGRRPRPSS